MLNLRIDNGLIISSKLFKKSYSGNLSNIRCLKGWSHLLRSKRLSHLHNLRLLDIARFYARGINNDWLSVNASHGLALLHQDGLMLNITGSKTLWLDICRHNVSGLLNYHSGSQCGWLGNICWLWWLRNISWGIGILGLVSRIKRILGRTISNNLP